MEGWLTIYNTSDKNSPFVTSSAKEQLKTHITALLHKYKDEQASVVTSDINVSAIVAGCPQVGDQDFKQFLEKLYNVKVLRVNNEPDFVPSWPSKLLTKGGIIVPSALKKYVDVGVELLIDSRKSPYLKHGCESSVVTILRGYHNFDCYYHTLCGWNGKNGDFDSNTLKKGFGFVNMFGDFVKDEYKIPVNWWVEKNKGMVLDDNGDWVLPQIDRADHDLLPVNE
ncbi:phospholipase A1-IIdelta-like protein [Tanacetum coccineum]